MRPNGGISITRIGRNIRLGTSHSRNLEKTQLRRDVKSWVLAELREDQRAPFWVTGKEK
jgi:hypothetical protein